MREDSVVWSGVCKECPIDGYITVEKQKMVVKNVKVHKVRKNMYSPLSDLPIGFKGHR